VLKALATLGRDGEGLVPSIFGRINRVLVPEWGVRVVLAAAAILVAAGGCEQRLIPFYAVAVFARTSSQRRSRAPGCPTATGAGDR
jgi:hypothetical protein